VAIAVVLVDDCIELVAGHATLAASEFKVVEERGWRAECTKALAGHRALELTERSVSK
jgi:hypothetical protein